MENQLEQELQLYDYDLPKNLIALKPSRPRDSARLLVYSLKNKKIKTDVFKNLGRYLPNNCVLVFNQTKVVPARLALKKITGGKVEILYIGSDKKSIKVIANKKLNVGEVLSLGKKLKFKIMRKKENFYYLLPNFPISQFRVVMQKYGQIPLPPYMKNSPLTESQRRKEYQSVFAKKGLSVAAPTASLHFTKKLVSELKEEGVEVRFVTLNVNLGTFAPLKEENLKTGRLHSEFFEVDKKTAADLNMFKKEGRPIIAVGTTVIRTLESASLPHSSGQRGSLKFNLKKLSGDTRLFIRPPYNFKFVDGCITNFHVPKSSLLMLISAITGRQELMKIYQQAIKKHFRFFSFGDGMLVL